VKSPVRVMRNRYVGAMFATLIKYEENTMRKIIIVYGLISGLIIIGSALWGIELTDISGDKVATLEYVGYLIMLIAMSVIFIGIKKYRDQELGGVITFSTAALVGLGISLVASAVYVTIWEIYLAQTDYAFMDDYISSSIAAQEAAGASAAELESSAASMEVMREQYKNPLFRLGMTFLEIFPIGLLITLISAAILRKSEILPANA
jgi:hypothetical protein